MADKIFPTDTDAKAALAAADLLLLADSAASNAAKDCTIQVLMNAVNVMTAKEAPVMADSLLLNDSEASNVAKKCTIQQLYDSIFNSDGVAVVLNEAGNDNDFRVESSGSTHMLFVDGGNDRVGILNDAPDVTLDVGGQINADNIITVESEVDNGNSADADTIDWNAGNRQKSTLTDNCTFTFTAPTHGKGMFTLKLIQDGTGSRTVTWPASVKWVGGTAPTLTTDASAIDICAFYWDGTSYYGVASLAFAVPA